MVVGTGGFETSFFPDLSNRYVAGDMWTTDAGSH